MDPWYLLLLINVYIWSGIQTDSLLTALYARAIFQRALSAALTPQRNNNNNNNNIQPAAAVPPSSPSSAWIGSDIVHKFFGGDERKLIQFMQMTAARSIVLPFYELNRPNPSWSTQFVTSGAQDSSAGRPRVTDAHSLGLVHKLLDLSLPSTATG